MGRDGFDEYGFDFDPRPRLPVLDPEDDDDILDEDDLKDELDDLSPEDQEQDK